MRKPVRLWVWRSDNKWPVSTAEFQQHPYCTHTILLIFLNSNFDCLRTSFGWGCRPCHRGKHFRFCSATSATTRQTSFRVHNHPVPTTSVEYLTVCELGKFNKSHKFYSYFRPILLIPKASCKPEEMSGRSSWKGIHKCCWLSVTDHAVSSCSLWETCRTRRRSIHQVSNQVQLHAFFEHCSFRALSYAGTKVLDSGHR